MNIKEEVQNIEKGRTNLLGFTYFIEDKVSPATKALARYFSNMKTISLGDKVEEFINWYYENMVKGRYTSIEEYHKPRELRDFIEEMAIRYEIRYPAYEINRIIPGLKQEQIEINDVMFRNNQYSRDMLGEDSDINNLDWSEFYNKETFIDSLPPEEKSFFANAKYQSIIFINSKETSAYLRLSENGIIEESEGIGTYTNSKILDKDIEGKHIDDLLVSFMKNGIPISEDNEIKKARDRYYQKIYFKEQLLNCIMYTIIERGGNRVGPRRAFLFAKEFESNIGIPMAYGIDYSDEGLINFINEYINAGGSEDLVCYENYFLRSNKHEKVTTCTIEEVKRLRLQRN